MGVDEDHLAGTADRFGQFGRELMTGDCVLTEPAGDVGPGAIVATQRIAVADDQRIHCRNSSSSAPSASSSRI